MAFQYTYQVGSGLRPNNSAGLSMLMSLLTSNSGQAAAPMGPTSPGFGLPATGNAPASTNFNAGNMLQPGIGFTDAPDPTVPLGTAGGGGLNGY